MAIRTTTEENFLSTLNNPSEGIYRKTQQEIFANIHIVLSHGIKLSSHNSEESKFLHTLLYKLKQKNNVEEVFQEIQIAQSSKSYKLIQKYLPNIHKLLVLNQMRYKKIKPQLEKLENSKINEEIYKNIREKQRIGNESLNTTSMQTDHLKTFALQ
jgi:hypothetical protein